MENRRGIEEIACPEGLVTLKHIQINKMDYDLHIRNFGTDAGGSLLLEFINNKNKRSEFYIQISPKGEISFSRAVYSARQGHCGYETLQKITDPEKALMPNLNKGELVWAPRQACKKRGIDYFRIPFGAAKVNY